MKAHLDKCGVDPGSINSGAALGAGEGTLEDAIFDCEQSPAYSTTHASVWPCELTHGTIFSAAKGRFATGGEHLCSQGLQMYPLGGSRNKVSRLKPMFDCLTRQQKIHLAGNGLCMWSVAAWILYVLGNTRRRPSEDPHDVLNVLSGEETDSEDDKEELDGERMAGEKSSATSDNVSSGSSNAGAGHDFEEVASDPGTYGEDDPALNFNFMAQDEGTLETWL